MLLAVNLWPDYGILAGIVIAVHWFYLFVIRKNQLSTGGTPKSYQTGGNNPHPSLESPEGKDVLSRPDFGPAGFASAETAVITSPGEWAPPPPEPVNTTNAATTLPAERGITENGITRGKELDATPVEPSAQSLYEESIHKKYAEVNLISMLEALSAGQLSQAAIVELENLASLTRETESINPFAMDKARQFLTEPPVDVPSATNQPPILFQ